MQWQHEGFLISDESDRLDVTTITAFLQQSYWAVGVPEAIVRKAIAGSLCFGIYDGLHHGAKQVGFARLITDRATFAYLADVFVLPEYRSKGLSKWLMRCVMEHPEVQGLRRWLLATRDAHGLYAQVGFKPVAKAELFMERHDPLVYQRSVSE